MTSIFIDFLATLADLTTDDQLDRILDGSVSPPHLCLGGLVQYRLNVGSRALLAKMPLFGIGLASDHSQLLLHRLVLAAEIANIDCGHERSPFLLTMPCRVPELGWSGTAGVDRKRPASSSGLER
jgi:hypothetical protein